jgi:CelD/BcsL family acetyltransferase involved in cellulose biosynthesis
MRYHVVDADSLSDDHVRLWADWQQADPALQSPYFAPQFVQLVAAVRPRCEVAVMQLEGETVGFLPYHRGRRNVAGPVAHTLTDYQGAVTRPGTTWNAVDLLRDCRLSALYFDHMLADQTALVPYHWRTVPSPYMDVRQ